MREKNSIIVCGIICMTLILFAVLFWPTLYNYNNIMDGKRTISVRINRITGTTETWGSFGWKEHVKDNTISINKLWKWHYTEISAKEDNYPIMVLRDGYKAIKIVGDNVLMGWNYELLNTSPKRSYIVTVNYDLEDGDGFLINESTSEKNVPPQEIRTLKQTTLVPCDNYNRIKGYSWYVRLTPDWKTEKLEGNRFERAGVILKKEAPYWLRTYLTYLFMNDFPSHAAKIGFFQTLFPHKWIIAQALDIKPEPKLKEIGKKLNLDFTKYNLPSWKKIISNPNYVNLGEKEKEVLKKFLRAQKDYGNYSPYTGREGHFMLNYDFPEPAPPVKEEK
jgi:hypothetical protein